MSHEVIKNILFEPSLNPEKGTVIYLENKNSISSVYHILNKIDKDGKYLILNFDINYYRFSYSNLCKSKVFYNPFSFSLNENNSLPSLIKNSKNILMIGLDYLPSKVLKQFLFQLTNLEYFNKLNLVFVCNQSIIEDQSNNQNLIKGFCNYLLNGISFKVDETKESFYEKYESYNLSKLKKESIIFEFSYKDNKILQFKEIKTYFGDIKNLFEGEVKLIKHDTTFNVQMTEKDLQMKNQVELPYLKGVDEKKENLAIEVDQEDFDEMYEEDPDQDLDI